jgi:hypothetical protein
MSKRKSFKESFDRIDRKLARQQKNEVKKNQTSQFSKNIRIHDLDSIILDEMNDDDEDMYYDDDEFELYRNK